ncbi:hypothetical protein SPRG_02475 [Saprolegnia parasitica CBS 223.65]|uniref:Armadillo repeat-containing domain-containing protein n=1 Tax=Saprolegnia parasitica (strain CBS 223.65) TaxID=695850 RepID=A0A067D167_SAPPC|nr:hypothetical protein SPRG_02475 [Saprolegnia parasitica CBS 223.65]KDO32777.1 hypothetical protein SPRG_02475 [Saprolegnia parasitica CBS 223.65]|eukprot:XP_012196441.1 hypothetical protein SPRG_02475 [Saprolegnia parasitica CBS 223.65]
MLSSRARLAARESAKDGSLARPGYLAQLVAECTDAATTPDAKLQCVAHLANFGYDPINYMHLLRLNVLDLFVDVLDEALQSPKATEMTTSFARLAMQGICNVAADPRFQVLLMQNDALPLLAAAIQVEDRATRVSGLTTLFFLLDAPPNVVPEAALRKDASIHAIVAVAAQSTETVVANTAQAFLSRCAEVAVEDDATDESTMAR